MLKKRYMGITEGGDAGIDFQWKRALEMDESLDGAIIITKQLNKNMFKPLNQFKHRIILHMSVTGYAETVIEPNTPDVLSIYQTYMDLLESGFPRSHVVLRIDPIIPTKVGLKRADKVMNQFYGLVDRVRISVLDMYPDVKKRFKAAGLPLPYGPDFQASDEQMAAVDALVRSWKEKYPKISYEACAEPRLHEPEGCGCISTKDYGILNIPVPEKLVMGGQRETCCCLNTKKELLGQKCQCVNECLYCYWKNAGPQSMEDEILIL